MSTIIVDYGDQIDIPGWVSDFASFRRWLQSTQFPEKGKICFINNDIWVDLSMEELFSHNRVRTEISRVLATLMKQTKYGQFVSEGMRFSHLESNLSTEPDGMVISNEAVETGRVKFVSGEQGDQTEVIGSPEIVIEVVSRSSEVKDTEWAMIAYFDAEIQEYWLVDARDEDSTRFEIYKRGKKEFVATRKQNGWVKSGILGKTFRLVRSENASGNPEFTLEVR
ncbi:MAG TPA: Uma2 family endonuclease [Gemmata sp.]|nr:Uma2 family endonuclease [Gemmata sp.]